MPSSGAAALRLLCSRLWRGLPFGRGLDHLADRVGALLQQQVVEVVAGVRWMGDPHPPPFGMEPTGGTLGDLEADALAIMVGEEDDARDLGRQDDLLQIARGQRRPDRQRRARLHDAERRLDALGEADHAVLTDLPEPHGAAGNRAQHHARLRHVGFARAVRRQIGAVDGDLLACGIAHDRDQRRVAGARVPVGQIGVEQEVGRVGDLQATAGQVCLARGPSERHRPRQDELDLARGVLGALLLAEGLGDRMPGAVDRRRAGELGRILDQRPPGQAGRVLERAERTAALVVIEVDPVAGALALERDHARALLARLVAPDVGEPQLVAHALAIPEVRGHPADAAVARSPATTASRS